MEIIEYPKALYLGGVHRIVDDAKQEEAARAEGYDDWHVDQVRAESNESDTGGEHPLDREALKARATELGLQYAPNIKTEKLAEIVAAAAQ